MKMTKLSLTVPAIIVIGLSGSACTFTPTEESKGVEIRQELTRILEAIEPTQASPILDQLEQEEVKIPRSAPWLAHRYDAQYSDTSKEAIETVLQGRPVIFELKNENNPAVSSPVDAITVKQHLDAIAVQADWSYVVDDGVVVFSDTDSRQFFIQSIPGFGTSRVAFNTLGGSDASQTTGASNSLTITNTPYADLQNSLASVVSDYVEEGQNLESATVYSLLPSANTLTVNGPPSLLRRVQRIVDDFNYSVSRKVHLIITVYDVSFSNSSQRSIDFNVLRQRAIATNASFQGAGLIPTRAGGLSFGIDFFEGNTFDSSTLVYNLLRQQGDTTVRLHEAFEATNNIVFSIEDQRTTPYISQVSIQRQDGGAISQLTPTIETEKISTGLGFHVVATIANENIIVRLSLSQSDLVRFDPYNFGSGENSISGTLPVTDNQFRVIPMTLKDGETRLIANLTQTQFRNDESSSGIGWLGRSNGVDESEKQTVIAVTAKIL